MREGARRLFLLSPASLAGKRASGLLAGTSASELARALRAPGGSTLAEVFTFTSSLYFRGKRAYARAFGNPPPGLEAAYVITTTPGLAPLDARVTVEDLRELARGSVDPGDPIYREPLLRTARELAGRAPECTAVLLGSVATDKYVTPLLEVWGGRLRIPRAFVGRGDMSRGGLMLRCVDERRELEYVAVSEVERRGERPAKLTPRRRGGPSARAAGPSAPGGAPEGGREEEP